MNLERWLQLRREGWLSVMPLGMCVAMASCCDKNIIDHGLNGNSNHDENRNGDKRDDLKGNGKGNGLGYSNGDGEGNKNVDDISLITIQDLINDIRNRRMIHES